MLGEVLTGDGEMGGDLTGDGVMGGDLTADGDEGGGPHIHIIRTPPTSRKQLSAYDRNFRMNSPVVKPKLGSISWARR